MYLGQVNQGINHEHAQKVAAFLQVFSKHSEKLLMETKENVRAKQNRNISQHLNLHQNITSGY